jgi:hypothetical protein
MKSLLGFRRYVLLLEREREREGERKGRERDKFYK